MTNMDSLSLLTGIITQGLGVLAGSNRETGIKAALDALFEDRYHSRSGSGPRRGPVRFGAGEPAGQQCR
jgi:hypothetical protein